MIHAGHRQVICARHAPCKGPRTGFARTLRRPAKHPLIVESSSGMHAQEPSSSAREYSGASSSSLTAWRLSNVIPCRGLRIPNPLIPRREPLFTKQPNRLIKHSDLLGVIQRDHCMPPPAPPPGCIASSVVLFSQISILTNKEGNYAEGLPKECEAFRT
jgi:hypothetical protein